jgi:hypothetical protein
MHVSKTICTILISFRRQRYKTHLYKYYVLKHKYHWLNGKLMEQNEVLPSITAMEFGIDNTGYGHVIFDRLQYVCPNVKCEWESE